MNEPGTIKKEPYKRLAEINRALTTSLNFDKVLDLIVENAAHLVSADVSLLLLLDKDGLLRIRLTPFLVSWKRTLFVTFSKH